VIDQKLENVEYFNSLGRMITNNSIFTREIKSRNIMTQAAFNGEKLFTCKLNLNLREKISEMLYLEHFEK
jgi:hypothetical protein